MTFSDETLMAYADNELDADARAAVDAALANDPDLVRRVARQHALLSSLRAAFDPVLDEPVPERLIQAALGKPAATPSGSDPVHTAVIDLAQVRVSRQKTQPARPQRWRTWAALAATLIVGVIAGRLGTRVSPPSQVAVRDGHLVAGEVLARALSDQLASTQRADAPVKIGLSFVARSGEFCRTFTLATDHAAGFACKDDQTWRVQLLAEAAASAGSDTGAYRQAASEMPPIVLESMNARIVGDPLDAEAENSARRRGWRR